MDCYDHYLERFTYQLPSNTSDTMKKNDSVTPSKNTPMVTSITNSDQLSHKQFVFPRCQSLGSRRHYHYLSHLPFDE